MNKKYLILILLVVFTFTPTMSQQKLNITWGGIMYTNIVILDENGGEHTAKAMISTAVDVCFIDSAFYCSLFPNRRADKEIYVGAEFGNVRNVSETTIDGIVFDGRTYQNVRTEVAPIIDSQGYKFVIGTSILDGQAWMVNMEDSTMTRIEQPSKGYVANIKCVRGKKKYKSSHLLFIPLTIQGKYFDCMFHTGANGIAITKKLSKQPWIQEEFKGGDNGLFHYNARNQYRLPNANVKAAFAKWEITEMVKYVPMLHYNCVGNIFFHGHSYVLDYTKNRIYIY